jgi:hypothetical protein
MAARPSSTVDRAVSAFLLLLMAVGSLLLWIGVPAGWLWVAGKITEDTTAHFLVSALGAPIAIIAWARVLFWLNRLYLRVNHGPSAVEPDPDEAEDDPPRWVRGPLEPLLVGSLCIALAAMLAWFFVLAESPNAAPW